MVGYQPPNLIRWSADPGTSGISGTSGPLAHSVRDCIEFFKLQAMEK